MPIIYINITHGFMFVKENFPHYLENPTKNTLRRVVAAKGALLRMAPATGRTVTRPLRPPVQRKKGGRAKTVENSGVSAERLTPTRQDLTDSV